MAKVSNGLSYTESEVLCQQTQNKYLTDAVVACKLQVTTATNEIGVEYE